MKVLFFSSSPFADCDFPLVKALQDQGVDVTYLITLPPFALHTTLFDIHRQISKTAILPATAYEELRCFSQYMDMSKVFIANLTKEKRSSWSYMKISFEIWQFIRNGHFDIVHCDKMIEPTQMFLFWNRRPAPVWVQTIHDPFPHSGETSSRKEKAYRCTMRFADRFVLLNESQKEQFCVTYNIDAHRVFTNRLGIYELIGHDKPVAQNGFLFFGRIFPYKGIEYLLSAFELVHRQYPDQTLTIAGAGEYYFDDTPYRDLPYIRFIHRYLNIDELGDLLSQATAVVCPYTDATQSGVIMTSYALAKPVIATRVGGLSESVEDGKSGLLVPPRNSQALADAMVDMLHGDTAQRMSGYIREHYVNGKFSWHSIAKKYIDIYSSLLRK